jgi:site-specific DNA recombinase
MKYSASKKAKKKGAVVYCRVSTREQTENLSLTSQERISRQSIQEAGLEILDVFVDEGKSARTSNRPQFKRMLEFCEKNRNRVAAVVMYRLDRIMRNNGEYYLLKGFLQPLGIRLIFATQPAIDDSPEGLFLEGMLSTTSQFESGQIGRRARDGMKEARRQGRLTNAPPIGYKWVKTDPEAERGEIVADPERAPYVTEAFNQYAAGVLTMAEIVRHVRSLGYTSPRKAKIFTQQNLYRMLRNRTYIGRVLVDDEIGWVKGNHPPLIDEGTFDKVQDRLEAAEKGDSPRTVLNPDFPLRAFIRCPQCGRHITGSFSRGKCGGRYPYYRCLGRDCRQGSIRKDRIESEFLGLLKNVVPTREGLAELKARLLEVHKHRQANVRSELKAAQSEIEELEAKVKTLHEAFVFERRIEKGLYDEMLPKLQEKLAEMKSNREQLQEETVEFEELIDFAFEILSNSACMWENAALEQRLALQGAIFPDGLTYHKETGFETPATSCHFNVLGFLREPELTVAVPRGIEPRFDG